MFWGHSIGGLICARLAGESREADAVILEATGESPTRMAREQAKIFPLVKVKVKGGFEAYDITSMLAEFRGPVLVVGAEKDKTLPVGLSRSLASDLGSGGLDVRYVEIPGASHMTAGETLEFGDAAKPFFASVSDRHN